MKNKQLFSVIKNIELSNYFFKGRVHTRKIDFLPFIFWPNGNPCYLANNYMLTLLDRGLSTKNNGGTLKQYAGNISHIIRYCYMNNIDLNHLTDDRFTHFINTLRVPRNTINTEIKARNSNTIINIGRATLDFLSSIGVFYANSNFIGPNGIIRAEKRDFEIKYESKSSRKIFIQYWHHKSFDSPDPIKKRAPIEEGVIKKLHISIPKLSSSKFLIKRRQVFLLTLEMLGARVGEIAHLKVSDIKEALKSPNHKLRIETLKGGGNEVRTRELPVLRQDLAVIDRYITIYRKLIIKNTIGLANDHDFLFISEKTGKQISANYLSNEVGTLRRAANIRQQACAHMFRHRFITKLFVSLILQYDFENEDQFRKALLDMNRLKQEVLEWTGHKSTHSLDRYIDLAFDEIVDFKATINAISLRSAIESYNSKLENLVEQLGEELSIIEFKKEFLMLKKLFDEDIKAV